MQERMLNRMRTGLLGGIFLLGLCGAAQAFQPARLNLQLDGLGVGHATAAPPSRIPTMRMAVRAPGHFASEVLSVFKMPIERFLTRPLAKLGLKAGRLRPYLLGGVAMLQLPRGNTVGSSLAGGERSSALHVGAGAEFRLRERAFLTFDFGEILHGSALSDLSERRCRFGMLFNF